MPENKISIFKDITELNISVKNKLNKGDAILIKGSRGMQMERVVANLMGGKP